MNETRYFRRSIICALLLLITIPIVWLPPTEIQEFPTARTPNPAGRDTL